MAYDLNRCPQNEAEATEYIYALFGRTIGTPANDWESVMTLSNLPHNVYTPGMRADASWPYFGITQMWGGSGGPRGRIFLPTTEPDPNGWYTRQIQVIADDPNGKGLIWAWQYWSGHEYAPVQGATGGTQPPVVVVPGGGLTKEEVQAMIDATIAALPPALQFGAKIALRTNSGLLAGIKGGGPTKHEEPIDWIGIDGVPHAWESFTLEPGE